MSGPHTVRRSQPHKLVRSVFGLDLSLGLDATALALALFLMSLLTSLSNTQVHYERPGRNGGQRSEDSRRDESVVLAKSLVQTNVTRPCRRPPLRTRICRFSHIIQPFFVGDLFQVGGLEAYLLRRWSGIGYLREMADPLRDIQKLYRGRF